MLLFSMPKKAQKSNQHRHGMLNHQQMSFEETQDLKTLKDINIGERGIVVGINASGPLRRRFMDMGITKGTIIQVVKYAPLGDPMELRLRDYVLSIRKNEAELIIVKAI